MEKIKLYLDLKKRDNIDDINHLNTSIPNGLLSCNMDEYFILNVNILVLIGVTVNLSVIIKE